MDEFELYGVRDFRIGRFYFTVRGAYDNDTNPPWEDDCIYDGVVSERRYYHGGGRPEKAPRERIIHAYRGHAWIFDCKRFAEVAIKQGCTRQQAHEQAGPAFERLRLWLTDQWYYIGLIVRMYDTDPEEDSEAEPIAEDSIWRIESDQTDYLRETANDMAQGMYREECKRRAEAWRAALREARERRYWARRGVLTAEPRA